MPEGTPYERRSYLRSLQRDRPLVMGAVDDLDEYVEPPKQCTLYPPPRDYPILLEAVPLQKPAEEAGQAKQQHKGAYRR